MDRKILEIATAYDKSGVVWKKKVANILWNILYLYVVTKERRLGDVRLHLSSGSRYLLPRRKKKTTKRVNPRVNTKTKPQS